MIPPIDIRYIADELDRLAGELNEQAEEQAEERDTDPRPLVASLHELLDALWRSGPKDALTGQATIAIGAPSNDITALGDHGIDLLTRLSALAGRLNRPQLAREIEGLTLPLACWVARCDAEILNLDPVVNGAAALANRLKQPWHLAQLYGLLREIGAAVSPSISQETSSPDTTRPWRVFLLNRAIVATRSHQPELMEEAFETLVDQLPKDAPEFFREGMEQMEALDYPPEVREIMETWYEQWGGRRVLH